MSALITLLYAFAAFVGAAFGFMELRMLARYLKHRGAIQSDETWGAVSQADENGRPWPTVTIQIPLYNERTSAEQIVRAAAAQEYPQERFDIQVLDDSSDETSEIVARVTQEVVQDGVRIAHVQRADRVGYKAGAMAKGLERSESEFVAVFDADFVPDPTFLRSMLRDQQPFEDPKVAFAQARWAWGADAKEGWLQAVLALLLDRHFHIQKPVRAFLGNVTTFNGSGGIWRRAAIDDAGGWTADTLTEDLDLSYRCALGGWHGRYLHNVEVLNELPGHMRAFKLQQRRWAKGTAQCLRKLTSRVMGSGQAVEDRWEEVFLLAGYAIHPVLFFSLLLWPWAVLYIDRTLFWVLQAFMGLGIAAAALSLLVTIRERDGGWSLRALREAVAGLAVGVGMMVNNTVGQVEGFSVSGGEFMRTPKGAAPSPNGAGGSEASGAPTAAARAYRAPLHWTFYGELAVMGYCVWGAYFLIQQGEPLWAIAMILWAFCLGLVAQQQLIGRRA